MREPVENLGDSANDSGLDEGQRGVISGQDDAEIAALGSELSQISGPVPADRDPDALIELADLGAADADTGPDHDELEQDNARQSLPELRENVDYFVNLYGILNVDQDAEPDVIKTALRDKTKEYTTDRQVGTATEFGDRAEVMSRLVNRAREILLDPDKRREYNELLAAWDGPISDNGRPVTTVDRMFARRVAGKDTEQVEALFQGLIGTIHEQPGVGTEKDVARAELRLDRARKREATDEEEAKDLEDEINDLQDDLEHALLALDVGLSIEESERSLVLGRGDIGDREGRHYRVSIDYAQVAEGEIEAARDQKVAEHTAIASGSFATRLALLSGEAAPSTDVVPFGDLAEHALPVYFNDQAAKVRDLAEKRQDIMYKRLHNMRVELPEEDLQTEQKDYIFVGLTGDEYDTDWFPLGFPAADQEEAPQIDIPDTVIRNLLDGNYAEVIAAGFGVVTTRRLENIEDDALIRGAATVYKRLYVLVPEEEPTEESE